MTIQERSAYPVSTSFFKHTGVPERIQKLFLTPPKNRQYVLRMPIRTEGGPAYWLPDELKWIDPLLQFCFDHQRRLGLDHPFCYVTVRHGLVSSETDDEWHVDGFSTKIKHNPEQNYIWCNTSGTEYQPLEVSFPDDFDPLVHNVNWYLQQFVTDAVFVCEPETLYCMDPYILHRRPASTAGTQRTFVRVSFVPIEINDVNNTQNPKLLRVYTQDGVVSRKQLKRYGEHNGAPQTS